MPDPPLAIAVGAAAVTVEVGAVDGVVAVLVGVTLGESEVLGVVT